MPDNNQTVRPITVGIGTRSYNATYSYAGLAPPGVRFVRAMRLPLNRIWPESLTARNTYVPLDPRLDLLHLMNGVVALGWPTPWVTSFESMIPRLDARHEESRLRSALVNRLLSPRCRLLIAWSEHARSWLGAIHDDETAALLRQKTVVFTGSTGPAVSEPKLLELPLRVAFVGGALLAKGGVALLRAAKRAADTHLPVEITMVGSPDRLTEVTPPAELYREEARSLLRYVTSIEQLSEADTRQLIETSHVLVLPSLQETLGWVTLEAMQRATVPIVAGIAAQPELVGSSGIVLPVPIGELGRWRGLDLVGREREAVTRETLDGLADTIYAALEQLVDDPDRYAQLSSATLDEYRRRFSPDEASRRLRSLYDRALNLPQA
jgi:glycosyltransferase involved in cell wall biosynthesis